MITEDGRFGPNDFPLVPVVIRESAILVEDTYVAAAAITEKQGRFYPGGLIRVGKAALFTLWLDITFGSATSVEIYTAFVDDPDAASPKEYQESTIDTVAGVDTLSLHSRTFATNSGTLKTMFTTRLPAAEWMKVYAKCTGTATSSLLELKLSLAPPGAL